MGFTGQHFQPKKTESPMQPLICKNEEELSEVFTRWFVNYVRDVLQSQDRFTIALSGGNTPAKFYRQLASSLYREQVEWQKLHFFWGDERYVSFDDNRNNAKNAFDALLNDVPVVTQQIHIIRTDVDPDASAAAYEHILHDYFDASPFSFDLVILGLGADAHTLSLFPGHPNIHEEEKWVMAFYLAEQQMDRITLTTTPINNARSVAFLVAGTDKAKALRHVLQGEFNPDVYPAQLVRPVNGKLYWFTDEAAASDIHV
jgi:6-phosphogluconolactonase